MEEEHGKTEVTLQEQVIPESIVLPPGSLDYIFGPRANRKSSWPELVGLAAEEAERKIKGEMPEARIQVIPPDYSCTCDVREERIRLFVDYSGKVTRTPRTG